MDKKCLTILGWIESLAGSQGLYTRLYNALMDVDEYTRMQWLSQFTYCKDRVQFVIDYESV